MKQSIDDPQGYILKLRPLYIELFREAHAIVGNLELAEYVLKKAIYEAYLRRGEWRERMSFREALGQTVRMVALAELAHIKGVGSFDSDWQPPVPMEDISSDQRQLYARLMRESTSLVRMLMLYYACGLRINQIAQVMATRPGEVRDALVRFRSRLERSRIKFGKSPKHQMEDMLEQLLLAMLQATDEDVPDSGPIFRAFERDAEGAPRARLSKSRVVATVLISLGAIVCAILFWVVAIIIDNHPVQPSAGPGAAYVDQA